MPGGRVRDVAGEAGFYYVHMCMRRVRRTVMSVCAGGNAEFAGTSLEVRGLLQWSVGRVVMSDLGTGIDRMKDPRQSALTHCGK